MRIGILLPWTEELESHIARVTAMGFHSGQISVWDMSLYTKERAAWLEALLKKYDFEVTALWCGWSGPVDWSYPGMYSTLGLVPAWLRDQRTRDLLQGAAFARQLGIRDVATHIGFIPDNPYSEDFIGIKNALRLIATEMKRYGQQLIFETGEELPVTLIQMMEAVGTGNLGVNFDPANLLSSGRANPVDALTLLVPYLGGMHAKDAVAPQGKNPKGHETAIGEGAVNFQRLVEILAGAGYNGDITIERETTMDETWEKEIQSARIYLSQFM